MACPRVTQCPFFEKHAEKNPVGCASMMLRFCNGPENLACARLEFYKMYGFKPDDDMTPLGELMTEGA